MKRPLIYLLPLACVILLCAMLPRVSALVQDRDTGIQYASMEGVSLPAPEESTALERLAVHCHAEQAIRIGESLPSHTQEEVLTLVQQALTPYREAGILLNPDLDVVSQTISCTPIMVSSGTRSSIAWRLGILHDEEEPVLWVSVDDSTGKLLSLDYGYSKDVWFDPDTSPDTVIDLYFTALDVDTGMLESASYPLSDGNRDITWLFHWKDPELGVCCVEICFWDYGFSITPCARQS